MANNGNLNAPRPANSREHFGDMINEIEDSVRESFSKLNSWADQARTVLDEKPGAIISSLAIAGFMAGALIRRGNYGLSSIRNLGRGQGVDPLLVLGAGAIMGWTFGLGGSTSTKPNLNSVSESRH
jgi:hypothetical protein